MHWPHILLLLVLSLLTGTAAERQRAPRAKRAASGEVVALLEESTRYMDSVDDTMLFGHYYSIESLQESADTVANVLSLTQEGPEMARPAQKKTDPLMKKAVWTFEKGLSRDDCVSITSFSSPGMYLRVEKTEVPVNVPPTNPTGLEKQEPNTVTDIGEEVESSGVFNSLSLPGPHGSTDALNPDIRESNTVTKDAGQDMPTETPTKTIVTVVVARNDDSLTFYKDATWCVRSPRVPSAFYEVKAVALESMGVPGFFLLRKTNPKFEVCPQNCNARGECSNVNQHGNGKCLCAPGYADADCGVRQGWPRMDNQTGIKPENKVLVHALQAGLSYAGIPQPFDGVWSSTLEAGLDTFTSARKLIYPGTPGRQWEALLATANAQRGWKSGAQTNVVKVIQMLLNRRFSYQLGEKPGDAKDRKVSGQFDEKTAEALRNFEARFGLPPHGIMGLDEWNKLIGALPDLQAMWPLEESHQLSPEEQVYFVQDSLKSRIGNCKLNGHYKWSDDLPINAAANQYKDINNVIRTNQKSLHFEFTHVHKGGFAECTRLKGQFDGARQFTVEMFFNPATIAQQASLFSACDKSMNGPYLEYRGTKLIFSISGQSSVEGMASMSENTWHYVAATYNGTSQKLALFLDGKLLGEKSASETNIPWVSRTDPSLQVAPVIAGFSGDLRYRKFWGKINNVYLSRVSRTLKTLSVKGEVVQNLSPVRKSLLDENEIAYSYQLSSSKGPKSWGGVKPAWKICRTGRSQSPIDLPPVVTDPFAQNTESAAPAKKLKYVSMTYASVQAKVISAGAQIGMALNGGELLLNSDSFDAQTALFHTPSEHTIDGRPTEMEMEVLHTMKHSNKTAIVSILFQRGPEMPALKHFMKNIGQKAAGEGIGNFDLTDVIPFDPGFLVYSGSLSYPPCTENATRIVIDKPITASMEQIRAIQTIVGNNARPLQNKAGRKVHRIGVDI